MKRIKNLLIMLGLTSAMLFGTAAFAHADDDHDGWRDRQERREEYREQWRGRDGAYYRRVWDPYRGWIVVRYRPHRYWDRDDYRDHDRGLHRGWYKHEGRSGHDRDDDD
jgi:hypothetical protein